MNGTNLCFFHNPDTADERKAAQRAGGVERAKPASTLAADTPDAPLESSRDIVGLLGQTINQVRRGEIDARIANTIGYLGGIMLRGLEQSDVEARLANLEAAVRGQSSQPGSIIDGEADFERLATTQ